MDPRIAYFSDVIQAAGICIQVGAPALLVGEPGNAKTSIVEALFTQLCESYHTSIAALHEPPYYGGYPLPSNGKGEIGDRYVALIPNRWVLDLVQASERGRVGIFLDELSSAPPATRAAALRGILAGVWGEVAIPHLSTVAAMNPPEMAESGYELSAPLANRFVHLKWEPPVAWWNAQQVADFPPPADLKLLPAEWKRAGIPKAKGYVGGFAEKFAGNIQSCPDAAEQRSGPWPSFRTWHWARDLLGACLALGHSFTDDVVTILIAGCVGPGVAREFLAYCQEINLPDPEALLRNPKSLQLPKRNDRAFAVLNSVTSAVLSHNTKERWKAGAEIIAIAAEAGRKDTAAAAARTLFSNMPDGIQSSALKQLDPFIELFQQVGMMTKAG
jgi:hypothetical protein